MIVSRRTALGGALAAVAALTGCARRPPTPAGTRRHLYRYGSADAQVAELLQPVGTALGVVVLVHGGYWRAGYDRHLEDDVAADLVRTGWAVWNLDYRAVGDGGGWPGTFEDVATGTDRLAAAAREQGLALDRVVAVGHSAGGTLALWLAARPHLSAGTVGAAPRVRVDAVAAQAGVDDLRAAFAAGLGGAAVDALLGGGPDDVPDRYAATDPAQHLPLGVPLLVVTGDADVVVPPRQSTGFAAAARSAGDDVRLEVVPGEGHYEHLEPSSGVWRVVRDWLAGLPAPRAQRR